jgi:hypothetical protein
MTSRSPVRDDAWECVYACVRVCVRIHPALGLRARHMAAEGSRGQPRAVCTVQLSSEGCEAVMYKPAGPRCSATVPLSRGGKWRAIIKGCVAPNVMSSLVFGLCLVRNQLHLSPASLPALPRPFTILLAGAAPASKSLPRAIFPLNPPDLHRESLHDPIASPITLLPAHRRPTTYTRRLPARRLCLSSS